MMMEIRLVGIEAQKRDMEALLTSDQSPETNAKLWLVATPLGNLKDFTYRGVEILASVDWIACEDSRRTRKLLDFYEVGGKKLFTLNQCNEAVRTAQLSERLRSSDEVGAIVSDAGTPLISDPGFSLVRACQSLGMKVSAIPGACAALVALILSGFPCHSFSFEGFLPASPGPRLKKLSSLNAVVGGATTVFYEAPHRLKRLLMEVSQVMGGEQELALAKELTKVWEAVYRGSCRELLGQLEEGKIDCRGEWVVVIPPKSVSEQSGLTQGQEMALEGLLSALKGKLTDLELKGYFSALLGVSRKKIAEKLKRLNAP